MSAFREAISEAVGLIVRADADFLEIVGLSVQVTGLAVVIACLIGFPLGALLAVGRFRGRGALSLMVSSAMGLPPVVVGLALYLLLSRAGPLGVLGLLYTPTAMVIAQVVLVAPIVAALTRQIVSDLDGELNETLRALRATRAQAMATLLWEARPALVTAALAGLGRAMAEVGAVMIVGGNIDHLTRVMTTAIALETSRGELSLALALGLVLLLASLAINGALMGLRQRIGEPAHG